LILERINEAYTVDKLSPSSNNGVIKARKIFRASRPRRRFVKPGTVFCSCRTSGRLRLHAARAAGPEE